MIVPFGKSAHAEMSMNQMDHGTECATSSCSGMLNDCSGHCFEETDELFDETACLTIQKRGQGAQVSSQTTGIIELIQIDTGPKLRETKSYQNPKRLLTIMKRE